MITDVNNSWSKMKYNENAELFIWIFLTINSHDNCNILTITWHVSLVDQEFIILLRHRSLLPIVIRIVHFLFLYIIFCVKILFLMAIVCLFFDLPQMIISLVSSNFYFNNIITHAPRGAGSAYNSGALEFALGYLLCSYCSFYCFLCSVS
jgi:hypothetical protein